MSAHYSLPWHGTHIYGATGCTSDTRRLPALFKKIARLKKPEANCVLASLKRIWAAVKANTKSHVGCCASRGCNLSGFPAFYSVAQAIILPNTRKLLATVKHRNAKVRGCGVTKFEDWLSFPEHISTKRKVSFTTSHCYKTVLSKKKKKKRRGGEIKKYTKAPRDTVNLDFIAVRFNRSQDTAITIAEPCSKSSRSQFGNPCYRVSANTEVSALRA